MGFINEGGGGWGGGGDGLSKLVFTSIRLPTGSGFNRRTRAWRNPVSYIRSTGLDGRHANGRGPDRFPSAVPIKTPGPPSPLNYLPAGKSRAAMKLGVMELYTPPDTVAYSGLGENVAPPFDSILLWVVGYPCSSSLSWD